MPTLLLGFSVGLAGAADAPVAALPSAQPEIRAQLSPRHATTLSAELPAKIIQLPLREGDRFKQGQLLASFDCAMQQAQLQKAQAVLQGAHKTYEVNSRLAKLESISALEVELAAAKMAEAQADIAYTRTTLAKCQINAPYDGRVAEVFAHAHQYLKVGDPIMDILNDHELEIKAIVPSLWLRALKVGTPFVVQLDETGKEYPAKITGIGARIDAVSQSVQILGTIDGAHDELLAGMSGKAGFKIP